MRKNPIELNSKERDSLEQFLKYWKDVDSNRAKAIALKIKVILLRDDNKPIEYIMKETGLSKRTIIYYTNKYLNNNRFFVIAEKKCKSILEINNVKSIFPDDKPPLSYREAKERILKKFNINISTIQIRNYLNRNGIYTIRSNHKLNFYAKRKLNINTRIYKEKMTSKKPSSHN